MEYTAHADGKNAAPSTSAPVCPVPVSFTVDVEELAPPGAPIERAPGITRMLMDFLEARRIRGSFFIDGGILAGAPDLVRDIARRGHEIGCHSYRHVDLSDETPAAFATGIADAKARLEDLAGAPVAGFRAPRFSLVAESRWAVAALVRAGFAYSSSVVPGRGLPLGYQGAPARPFLWSEGLLEIPCPVHKAGPWSVPFMGGMTLRWIPPWRYRIMLRQATAQTGCWTFCHPHDVDPDAGFRKLPQYGWTLSAMLSLNRRVLLRRWAGLARNPAPPLGERVAELGEGAPVF